MLKSLPLFWLKAFIHVSALIPVIWLYYGALGDTLGADPVERVIHFTGIGAFNVLLVTLCISPIAKQIKWPALMKCRRLLGLYAAFYALLHLLNFIAFDLQFDLALLGYEIIERPYITIGMLAFVIMLLLSVTSFEQIKKKMGRKWQTLHNFIYVMALLIGIHFYWSVKSEIIEPSIYLVFTCLLLFSRKQQIQRWLISFYPRR